MANDLTPISKDLWMPDSSTKACISCERTFTALRRRHHCRFCGLIYCSACSHQRVTLAQGQKPVRICKQCAHTFARSALSHSSSMIAPGEANPLPPALALPIGLDEPSLRSESVSSFASSFSAVTNEPLHDRTVENTLDSIMQDLASVHCDFDESCASFLQTRTLQVVAKLKLQARWAGTLVSLVK